MQRIHGSRRGSSLFVSAFTSLAALTISQPVVAEPIGVPPEASDVIVTAYRSEAPVKDTSASVSVIQARDIKERGASTVVDLLRQEPGVEVVQAGGPGQIASVFLRGANSEHTLVMIDGVLMNNPITPTRSFNLASIPVENVERIEIVRGPQSSMYGSDALGGIIHVITRRGSAKLQKNAFVEGGSFGSVRASADISGKVASFDYSLGASKFHTDGISAAAKRDGNRELDGANIQGISTRVGYKPIEPLALTYTLRYNQSRLGIDNFGGIGGDDSNREVVASSLASGFDGELSLMDGKLKPKIGITYAAHSTKDTNPVDAVNTVDSLQSRYKGSLLKAYSQVGYQMAAKTFFVAGFESLRERGDSFYHSDSAYGPYNEDFAGKQARTNGYFGDIRTTVIEGLSIDIGVRADDNQRFDRRTTWRFAPQYKIEATGTRIKSMIGTGYKAPSLYEIFSMYGSRDLNPERSLGWDLGIEQEFAKGALLVGATYFHNRFKNLISFDPATYIFKNISAARTAGVELTAALRLADSASVNLSYTYTDPTDTVTGQRLLRRTRNRAALFSTYRWCDRYTSSVGYTWIGARIDNDFSQAVPARTSLGGYGLLHIGGTAQVAQGVQVEARLENALDKRYQEIYGYGTPGLAAYGGVRFTY